MNSDITVIVTAAIGLACIAVFVGLLGGGLFLLFRRPGRRAADIEPNLHIDIAAFPCEGPPAEGPQLSVRHLPVRLVVVVTAPSGRDGAALDASDLPMALEFVTPGLGDVFRSHQPDVRCWPPQLSSEGFMHAFFRNADLPNDDGRGSPWCCIAGKFQAGDASFLLGLICCAAAPNSLTRIEAPQPTDWQGVLSVRYPEAAPGV